MDRKVHAGNSSSQNDKTVFGRIERGVSRNSFTAVAEDGSSFFISGKQGESFGLSVGENLTEQQYSDLKERIDFLNVQSKAVELLAVREHSAAELRLKLSRRKFPEKSIDQVLASLTESGLLSDRRFAELWVRVRLKKHPEARTSLSAGLARKGVDRALIKEILDNTVDDEVLDAALNAAAGKLLRSRSMGRDKMMRALMRRGFDYGHVLAIVNKNFPDREKNY